MATPDQLRQFLDTSRPVGCARLSGTLPDGPDVATSLSERDSKIVGYAQLVNADGVYTLDCVADAPAARDLLVTSLAPQEGELIWWGHELPVDAALAASLRMPPPHRRLLNMSRPLPLESALANSAQNVSVRPFVVGEDEAAWLQVNNAAFSWHGEQGDWDVATLHERMAEPWFDAAGLLMYERGGRLAGFCWTKTHADAVGEIHVIAVHPDFHGLGLGRALTVAGLRHLADSGSTKAMLYVEADNTAAVRLYESLGFDTTHTDVAYRRSTNGDTT